MFNWVEAIGYVASGLVVLSLSMTSVVRLRLISLTGSTTFLIYGALIGAMPIIITNVSIACLNVWFLAQEFRGKRDLGTIRVSSDSPFLRDFLHHHAADIAEFQPDFDVEAEHDFNLVLMRDGFPAGAIIGRQDGTDLRIELDYVLREYRDSRLGHWLYGPGTPLRKEGLRTVTSDATNIAHESYLRRVGFEYGSTTKLWTTQLSS